MLEQILDTIFLISLLRFQLGEQASCMKLFVNNGATVRCTYHLGKIFL